MFTIPSICKENEKVSPKGAGYCFLLLNAANVRHVKCWQFFCLHKGGSPRDDLRDDFPHEIHDDFVSDLH